MRENETKLKLPNGLTISYYDDFEISKSSGNKRKFQILEIKEGKSYIQRFYKCVEFNDVPHCGSWSA